MKVYFSDEALLEIFDNQFVSNEIAFLFSNLTIQEKAHIFNLLNQRSLCKC